MDDSIEFLDAASRLLSSQGFDVVGVASTGAEALARVGQLDPDVTIVDVDLDGESGFDVAWELAASSSTSTILMSARSESDFGELVAVTPVLGFISKTELSAGVVSDFLADRCHGHGCRHEALVYSSTDELAAATLPFMEHGLARDEHVLVVLRERSRTALEGALGHHADRIEFADAVAWYRSPENALQEYTRYVDDHLERGASRVRVVAEVIWPASSATSEIEGWKRYEAGISGAMASVPVSFICAYDTQELPERIVADARRMHPVVRTAAGARPSAHYAPPGTFLRGLSGG